MPIKAASVILLKLVTVEVQLPAVVKPPRHDLVRWQNGVHYFVPECPHSSDDHVGDEHHGQYERPGEIGHDCLLSGVLGFFASSWS